MTLFDMMYNENTRIQARVSEKEVGNNLAYDRVDAFPNVEFGKTYYMPIGGALRAVRFESLVDMFDDGIRRVFLVGTAAKLGKFTLGGSPNMCESLDYQAHIWKNDVTIYASPADFEKRKAIPFTNVYVTFEQMFKFAFGKQFDYVCCHPELKGRDSICYNYHYGQVAKRYEWNGTYVVSAGNPIAVECNKRIEIAPNGLVLIGKEKKTLADFAEYFAKTYATIAECKSSNEVVVVEFDEPQPEQTAQLQVTIRVTTDMLPQIVSLGAVVVA